MVRDSSQEGEKNSTVTAQWEMHSSEITILGMPSKYGHGATICISRF